jgi:hypothetical protein
MAAGGKVKKGAERRRTYSAGSNMLTMPDSLITNRRKATALERTSPKADRALSDLEAKQEELAMRNMLRDELGSKLDDPNFRVEMGGKKVQGLKKGGKVRGCGVAQRGLTKGRMV